MLKTKLMKKVKEKFGGDFIRTNGRWYWNNELVSTNWLLNKLKQPIVVQKEEIVVKETAKQEVISAPEFVQEKKPVKKKKENNVQ